MLSLFVFLSLHPYNAGGGQQPSCATTGAGANTNNAAARGRRRSRADTTSTGTVPAEARNFGGLSEFEQLNPRVDFGGQLPPAGISTGTDAHGGAARGQPRRRRVDFDRGPAPSGPSGGGGGGGGSGGGGGGSGGGGGRRRWFRPGSGMWTEHILQFARRRGYEVVLGNVYQLIEPFSSRDWPEWPGAWLTALFVRLRARAGGIVILHDRKHTPRVLELALPDLVRRFEVVSLSELAAAPVPEPVWRAARDAEQKGKQSWLLKKNQQPVPPL